MSGRRAAELYGALLRLYPRHFREEYGLDLVQLFRQQLRDESAVRVWARAAVDLAITLPTLHLETRMKRPSRIATPLVFAGLSVAGLLFAVIGGSSWGALATGLLVATASGALSVFAWRPARTVTAPAPLTAHWWKFLAGGSGVLAAVVVGTSATGEVASGWWWPTMATIALALATLATGLVLGVACFFGSRTHHLTG